MITHVVFDLNGTLVHKSKVRPRVSHVLAVLRSRGVRVIVWTSATRRKAVKRILPFKSQIDRLITRDECCVPDPNGRHYATLKPVSFLGVDPKSVMFVDDSLEKIRFNKESYLFRIAPFTGCPDDRELMKVLRYVRRR